jgi:hypothetical protein
MLHEPSNKSLEQAQTCSSRSAALLSDRVRHDKMLELVERIAEFDKEEHSGKLALSQVEPVDREIAATDQGFDDRAASDACACDPGLIKSDSLFAEALQEIVGSLQRNADA